MSYKFRSNKRSRRPNLERVYGWYKCNNCWKTWESAYTWKVRGTDKVYYKQDCKKCGKARFPYATEPILCQKCYQKPCKCDKRHSDPKKNHIQSLCHKCRDALQPCSFR